MAKVCTLCQVDLPLENFQRSTTGKYGRRSICKACDYARRKRPRAPYVEPSEKLCRGCNLVLPIDSFTVRTERANGRRARCRECVSKAHESWRERNPGASRSRNLKSKYGLTEANYLAMLDSQGGGCAVCQRTDSGWSTSPWLHVDHDHTTGEVRSLLCHPCNIVIGYIESGTVPIDKAVAYLR